MKCQPELLKPFANRLARLFVSKESTLLTRRLQLAGLFASSAPQSEIASLGDDTESNRVGIWERKSTGQESCFVRSMDKANEWNMWANKGRIEPKGTKRRIVLIGESVARGYLYDPFFTPAGALEKMLQPCFAHQIEVIDLARLGLVQKDLVKLARSAASLLQPDMLVIFAGNNWGLSFSLDFVDPGHRAGVSATLEASGVSGLKRFAEAKLKSEISHLVGEIASIYQPKKIPVTWVIPEFNLGDWRDPEANAPYLEHGANEEWILLLENARKAMRGGELAKAEAFARRMIELDKGVCVSGFHLLADCSRQAGNLDSEKYYLKCARDALIWDNTGYLPPRSYTVVQDSVREEVPKYGMDLVDLPLIFDSYLGGRLPGRRLFVDHCHLTSEAIRLAMAALGACLVKRFTGATIDQGVLLRQESIAPTAEVEAEANLLAAIHNAHWWQSGEVIEHFCTEAVKQSKHIVEMISAFIEMQIRHAPLLMTRSANQFSRTGAGLVQSYAVQYRKHLLDEVFLRALERSAKALSVDCTRFESLQKQEHSVTRRDIDLLDYYYCSASRQPRELMWSFALNNMHPSLKSFSDYYKAYGPESRFCFVGETSCAVRLRVTLRLPGNRHTDFEGATVMKEIRVLVNRTEVAVRTLGHKWETWHISIPADVIRYGLNEVAIEWPHPEFPSDEQLQVIFENCLESETSMNLYPVFGEIHSFVASAERDGAPCRHFTPTEPAGVYSAS
jgi:hypothetical protein